MAAAISDWWELAACQSANTDLFFPISGSGPALADVARAKAVCAVCPVRQRCLDFAIENGEFNGVWGGTSEQERRAIAASRHRRQPQPA